MPSGELSALAPACRVHVVYARDPIVRGRVCCDPGSAARVADGGFRRHRDPEASVLDRAVRARVVRAVGGVDLAGRPRHACVARGLPYRAPGALVRDVLGPPVHAAACRVHAFGALLPHAVAYQGRQRADEVVSARQSESFPRLARSGPPWDRELEAEAASTGGAAGQCHLEVDRRA